MRYADITRHLNPYGIVAHRKTTINHAFAAAVAPCDMYDELSVRAAISLLGQDPDSALRCVYCDVPAETWDHVFAMVLKSKFSGHGHRLGNLLPCCKQCNSRKGNKNWQQFLETLPAPLETRLKRVAAIQRYLDSFPAPDPVPEHLAEYQELQKIKEQIIALMARADVIAKRIRERD